MNFITIGWEEYWLLFRLWMKHRAVDVQSAADCEDMTYAETLEILMELKRWGYATSFTENNKLYFNITQAGKRILFSHPMSKEV